MLILGEMFNPLQVYSLATALKPRPTIKLLLLLAALPAPIMAAGHHIDRGDDGGQAKVPSHGRVPYLGYPF